MIPLALLIVSFFKSFAGGDDSTVVTKEPEIKNNFTYTVSLQPNLVSEENASQIRAGLIYDFTTKTIVWEKDMGYAYPVASLTKMMVALIAIEELKAGNIDWQDEINITRKYKKSRRSKKTFTVHHTYTVEGLIKLAMIPSNNEACGMLAKHISGNVEVFVKRMNERAFNLGMTQTFFSNPSGLPSDYSAMDNSSSPKDLLLLANELIKYDEILNITDIGYADVSHGNGSAVYRNHNGLVIQYPDEVDGLKTGYTRNARFCLVATAKKNNHRLVAIALGAPSPQIRNGIVADMLNNYFQLLGYGRMGNQPDVPLLAAVDTSQKLNTDGSAIASLESIAPKPTATKTVYKTITSIVKKPHVVKSGQTLSEIAEKYDCSVNELKKWNRLKGTKVLKGQKLFVHLHVKKVVPVKVVEIENYDSCEDDAPECGNPAEITPAPKENKAPVKKQEKKTTTPEYAKEDLKKDFKYHTVQKGDTLWSIAMQNGVTVTQLKKLNPVAAKGLKAGTKIKVPVNKG